MKHNHPVTQEQVVHLSGGRTIFKTHNGFRCFLQDNRGTVLPVTSDYYTKLKQSV